MKRNLLAGLISLLAVQVLAADTNVQTEVRNAAAALGNQAGYSWRTTVEVGNNSPFRPGPMDGKTEKGGYTYLILNFGDNTSDVVLKGTNAVIKTPDSGWLSLAEAAKDDGGGGFNPTLYLARMIHNFKVPAVQAADLAGQVKELKKDTNGISGDFTEEGAKKLFTFRPRGGGEALTVSNAKGWVKFWIQDGKLSKYQFHAQGTVSFDGNDRDIDRTTTVEIKDVNATKIDVPDDAKKKL
ncbi:MAG TPA: hypothetical protein VMB80_05360 [Candidatus Acidoferrum sp.]|nr:hypothetical protein [Candidatus Acidoferrum sp.]